jgi:hypothetical protein
MEQERRRPALALRVAAAQEARERRLEALAIAEPLLPGVRDPRELRIQRRAQPLHARGQRVREIAVLAAAEAVRVHRDRLAERVVARVDRRELRALARTEQVRDARVAPAVEIVGDALPVGTNHGRVS